MLFKSQIITTLIFIAFVLCCGKRADGKSPEELKEDLISERASNLNQEDQILSFLRTFSANRIAEPHFTLKRALPLVPNPLLREKLSVLYGDFLERDSKLSYRDREEFFKRQHLWAAYHSLKNVVREETTPFDLRIGLGELYTVFFEYLHTDQGIEIFNRLSKPGESSHASLLIKTFLEYENEDLRGSERSLQAIMKDRRDCSLLVSFGVGGLLSASLLPFNYGLFGQGMSQSVLEVGLKLIGINLATLGTGLFTYRKWNRIGFENLEQEIQLRKGRMASYQALLEKLEEQGDSAPKASAANETSPDKLQRATPLISKCSLGLVHLNKIALHIRQITGNLFY